MKMITALLGLLLLCTFSQVYAAAVTSYQVELIVFSQLNGNALDSEQWPRISPAQASNLATLNLDNADARYAISANDHFFMQKELARLAKDPHYKVLLHTAWVIPAAQLGKQVTLHLYGGQAFNASAQSIGSVTDESSPYSFANTWQLNGTLKLDLNRFFNLSFNLTLAEPSSVVDSLSSNGYFNNNSDPYVYFKLQQGRRMRSNELNYIGHPLFGVLVKIMPSQDDRSTQHSNNQQNA